MPASLLYHDVVPVDQADASGFPGISAARYKLSPEQFHSHLEAIAAVVSAPPSVDLTVHDGWRLTFDDGGASALRPIADLLEERGWRGHFFVTTDYVGRAAFLTAPQIRELRRRGHAIGSHSCSHPPRLSACSPEELRREWRDSRHALEEILGEAVTSAAVPGGFYSLAVGRAAAEAGYAVLFTSEPTNRSGDVMGCRLLGRYSIVHSTSAIEAAALLSDQGWARRRQAVTWQAKKLAKAVGGRWYLDLRARLLRALSR